MKPVKFLKVAVSTLVVGMGMVGAGPAGLSTIASATDSTPEGKIAAAAFRKAQSALKKLEYGAAIVEAEKAVAFAPDRADYRMALAQAYLGAGRLSSAEMAFGDVLTLDPSNARAGLNRALMQVALGRPENALETLDQHRDVLAASDFGLASALAGDTATAVKVLNAAARVPGADVKTRQNLALALALDGQWAQARLTAALDLPSDQLDARMMEWTQFARPTSSSDQVASLMGVRPVVDAGQPERLALVLKREQQVAAADPVADPVAAPVVEAPAQIAEFTPPAAEAALVTEAPQPAPSFEVAGAAIASVPANVPVLRAMVTPIKQAVVPVSKSAQAPRFVRPIQSGQFVVQLGAFSNEGRAQVAWDRASGRIRALNDYSASTARVQVRGASLYRLSVAGFATREDANRVCTRVKASGGECFVRSIAGDKPMQWVSRGGTRFASRR